MRMEDTMEGEIAAEVEAMVLVVHRRNGGTRESVDMGMRLLAPELKLDSLDLAEFMAGVERRYGRTPFEGPRPPLTWGDVVKALSGHSGPSGAAGMGVGR